MFSDASSFNGDLTSWDVSKVTSMQNMFERANSYTRDLNTWNLASVTTLRGMFFQNTAFNGDISGWDVSNVAEMHGIFENATAFNRDISGWNVSNVYTFRRLFMGASSFRQILCPWGPFHAGANTTTTDMFLDSNCSTSSEPDWNANPPGPLCAFCATEMPSASPSALPSSSPTPEPGWVVLWGDTNIDDEGNDCEGEVNNVAIWTEIASNGGNVLFDISRSDFHGYWEDTYYHAHWDIRTILPSGPNTTPHFFPFLVKFESSGTLDEVGVLDDIRTLIIPAPGGGTYSFTECCAIKNFVLNGGRLIFTADRSTIAAAAMLETNNILATIGSTLKFENDNMQKSPANPGTLVASSISTTTGPLCMTTGSEITMNLTHGDEAIAKFDNGRACDGLRGYITQPCCYLQCGN